MNDKPIINDENPDSSLRQRFYTVIFGTDTPAGKLFDMVLIYAILLSVLIVILDSVNTLSVPYGNYLVIAEWVFTIAFTIEYATRITISPKPWGYVLSFYGIVDLLSILPSYLGLIYADIAYLLIVRLLRVLRVFRVLKLMRYMGEANLLMRSMLMSRRKIFIFFSFVLVLAVLFGSLMFVVEGPENGFTSIPRSVYWTIVTITTVGYGDITPHTVLGQVIATLVMLTGYSIIAVPTGIFTAEIAQEMQRQRSAKNCPNCNQSGHEVDADYCRNCGAGLPDIEQK
ncbi:MAG: voltage-gated potassium channel [Candidatus Endobugula sp.]|jgi:voltage-gated potassium channel